NKSLEAIGWLENTIGYRKDSSGVYQKSLKNEYIYNQSDEQVATYQNIWQDSAWNLIAKDTLIYNDDDNTFDRVGSSFIDNAWQPVFRIFLQYDELQNVTVESTSNWVDGSEVVYRQIEYFYNENKLDSLIRSWDNGDGLEQSNKGIYTYDENGYLIQVDYHSKINDQWLVTSSTIHINNDDGYAETIWNLSQTDTISKMDIYYNELNFDTLNFVTLKDTNGIFQPYVREINRYDGVGNLIEFILENYVDNSWDLTIHMMSEFDLSQFAVDYIYPKDWVESYEMVNKITEFNQLWKIDSALYDDIKALYNYSLIDGINKHEASQIKVYPNPAKDHILVINDVIPNASIEVYNLSGVLIYNVVQQSVESEIDLSRFPSGVYIVRVFNNESSKVVKIIKE
ncbi:MAG TPA: T9SS type A sorting domain-containing protein, partial [Bacteroidetes bacterium]|nr:T9SS type A sorting domain-containing protein [Bacteroidota bacterium]